MIPVNVKPVGPRRRTSRLAAPALMIVLSAVTGCAANFGAQTNQIYQPADGVSNREGDVYGINVLVVGDEEGDGTVLGTLINQQSDGDELTDFTSATLDGTEIASAPLGQPVALASQGGVALEQEGLSLGAQSLVAGDFVQLTFTFANAAPLELEVPVQSVGTVYEDVEIIPISADPPAA